jgi:hypothetical protein
MFKSHISCPGIISRNPVSPPGKSIWVLWWWEWPWDRFYSGASKTFQQCSISYLSINYPRPILKILTEINAKVSKDQRNYQSEWICKEAVVA